MSSDNNAGGARIVYRSRKRTVVTDGSIVAEIAGDSGWMRRSGSGGPLSGEVIATMTEGLWSKSLSQDEASLVDLARQ